MRAQNEFVYILNEDPPTRSTLCGYLEGAGLATIACSTAGEYTSRSVAMSPVCVVLNSDLPEEHGFDLHPALVAAGIPIVFVVAQVDVAMAVRALKAGAVDFLVMPISAERFVSAIESAIEQYRCTRGKRAALAELQRRRERLTPREGQVMRMVVSGLMNKQVAQELGISEITVQIHRGRIMQKMEAKSFAHLVRMAQALEHSLPIHLSDAGCTGVPRGFDGGDINEDRPTRAT